MNISIFITLIIIITCLFFNLLYVIYRKKNELNVKGGPSNKIKIPEIQVINKKNDKVILKELLKGNKLFLFVDTDCSHCQQVMKSFDFFRSNLSEDIIVILQDSEENKKNIAEYLNLENIYFLDENTLFTIFNINAFPFYLIMNNDTIEEKGYMKNGTLIDFFLRKDKRN